MSKKKKSFTDENPALAFINKSNDSQKSQDIQKDQEEKEIKSSKPKTQGRKGKALPRINMAFYPGNYEYIKLISRIEGVSMTRYVNDLIEKDRLKNKSKMKKIREFLK